MSALNYAIRLSSRMPVFPCLANKKPACTNGFKNASRDPKDIVSLWNGKDFPLIGVPTGEISGFDVLDIDPKNGGSEWFEECKEALPITRHHITQSGGRHVLFRHAKGVKNSQSKIAPGIDTRGDGGYIIWWPALGLQVTDSKTLDDWPKWLIKILCPPPTKKTYFSPASVVESDTRAALMIARAYDRVRNARPGERHYMLLKAAATLGGLERFFARGSTTIQQELVELAMQAGGQDRVNAEKTAAWAMDKGRLSPLLDNSR